MAEGAIQLQPCPNCPFPLWSGRPGRPGETQRVIGHWNGSAAIRDGGGPVSVSGER